MVDEAEVERLRGDPHFKMLARSLWQETELRGAALMVGAGFSRNADRTDPAAVGAPLWRDLASAMAQGLGHDPSGEPLELAQLYVETFGRPRLDELVRTMIDDADLEPGALHARLMRLGWTDVLTTNYDTLLERAAAGLHERSYETVLTTRDIARTRAPRVVKLHGSLPSLDRCVITRSDYEDYPTRSAPFVNLARQVLLENDLCMVGFSGEDPNFVQWTSWVAENISDHARPLFLAGVGLSDPQRVADLRARNIRVIDLTPYTGSKRDPDAANRAAMDVFLAALEAGRPIPATSWGLSTVWPPTEDLSNAGEGSSWPSVHQESFAADFVLKAAPLWRVERETYPGWLQPPPQARDRVAAALPRHLAALQNGLRAVATDERPQVLADVLFRVDLAHATLQPWDLPWIVDQLDTLRDALNDRDKELVARLMLRTARENDDERSFERWSAWAEGSGIADCRSQVVHARALKARDALDWETVRSLIPAVKGRDPAWTLRRAALMAEIGDGAGARDAIFEALRSLRTLAAKARRNLWIRSRLAWASLLGHVVGEFGPREMLDPTDGTGVTLPEDGWQLAFEEGGCNPWPVIERLDDDLLRAQRQRDEDRAAPSPRFDPGVTSGNRLIMRSSPAVSVDRYAQRLADRVGLPGSIPGVYANLMSTRIGAATEVAAGADAEGTMRCIVAATREERSILERRFDRISVALLDNEVATEVSVRLRRAIVQAIERLKNAPYQGDLHEIEALSTWMELLSRLVVRLAPGPAGEAFELAVRISKLPAPVKSFLSERLGALLQRTITSLVGDRLRDALRRLHDFPLSCEGARATDARLWPEPFSLLEPDLLARYGCSPSRGQFEAYAAGFDDPVPGRRETAGRTLEILARTGLLTDNQREATAAFLRPGCGSHAAALPARVMLPLMIQVSSGDASGERQALRDMLVGGVGFGLERCELVRWIGVAAPDLARSILGVGGLLTLFDQYAGWRPSTPPDDPLSIHVARVGTLAKSVASALSRTVLALLSPCDLPAAACERLEVLACDPPTPYHLVLGPQIVRLHPPTRATVANNLRRGLSSNVGDEVAWSILAVREWLRVAPSCDIGPLPETLRAGLVALALTRCPRAMPDALSAVPDLVEHGLVQEGEALALVEAMGFALEEYHYGSSSVDGQGIATLSLVRAGAMRICQALEGAGHDGPGTARILELGRDDPLPEVRSAARQAARDGIEDEPGR